MTDVIIVDIDGCLARTTQWEKKYFTKTHGDVDGFLSHIHEFPYNEHVLFIVNSYLAEYVDVLFLTARPIKYEAETIKWLSKEFDMNDVAVGLRMHCVSDCTDHVSYKIDVIEKMIKDGVNVSCVIEDSPLIIEAYQMVGLPIIQIPNKIWESFK